MKIVKESLLEFERAKVSSKIGKIRDELKTGSPKYMEVINWLSKYVFRKQYELNPDLSINIVKGDFIISERSYMEGFPKFIKFNVCEGDFIIEGRLQDMIGFPEIVKGSLGVSENKLRDLKGCPKIVEGDFHIIGNPVKFSEEEIRKVCQVGGTIYA